MGGGNSTIMFKFVKNYRELIILTTKRYIMRNITIKLIWLMLFVPVTIVASNPRLVDLNLPSGTLWCANNLEANSSEEFGGYYTFNKTADIATELLGEKYATPSREDFDELVRFTIQKWVSVNGVEGVEFTGFNGVSIFLPAAAGLCYSGGAWETNNEGSGSYWSSTESGEEDYNYFLEFNDKEGVFFGNRDVAYNRLPIRPVSHVYCDTDKDDISYFEVDGVWYHVIGCQNVEVTRIQNGSGSYSESPILRSKVTYNSVTYNVIAIGKEAFYKSTFKSIQLPEGILWIGNEAFGLCESLVNVIFPASLLVIDAEAFDSCTSLTSVSFPKNSSLIKLDWEAFENCYALQSVDLPAFLQVIVLEGTFEDCPLTEVTCRAMVPPTATSYEVFDEGVYKNATLNVYSAAIESYRNTFPWSEFKKIKALPEDGSGVTRIEVDNNGIYSVYSLNGKKVMSTSDANELNKLPAGIYIINGNKVIITR